MKEKTKETIKEILKVIIAIIAACICILAGYQKTKMQKYMASHSPLPTESCEVLEASPSVSED